MLEYDLKGLQGQALLGNILGTISSLMYIPHGEGPVIAEIELDGGKIIEATYPEDREAQPDVICRQYKTIPYIRELRPFVEKLLEAGTPFVTETGSDDTICTLRWTIR